MLYKEAAGQFMTTGHRRGCMIPSPGILRRAVVLIPARNGSIRVYKSDYVPFCRLGPAGDFLQLWNAAESNKGYYAGPQRRLVA